MTDMSLSAGIERRPLTWLDLGFHPFTKSIRARNGGAGIKTIIAALRPAISSARWRSRRSAAMRESWPRP